MAASSLWISGILTSMLFGAVASDCYYDGYMYYCYYYNEISVGTIIGAVVGGIVGLILLSVLIVVVCVCVCKKKAEPGTIILPGTVSSTMTSAAAYNAYPNNPQQQGWGVQPSAPVYPGYGQQQYPPPGPQPMPPPNSAGNVIQGQPPQNTN